MVHDTLNQLEKLEFEYIKSELELYLQHCVIFLKILGGKILKALMIIIPVQTIINIKL